MDKIELDEKALEAAYATFRCETGEPVMRREIANAIAAYLSAAQADYESRIRSALASEPANDAKAKAEPRVYTIHVGSDGGYLEVVPIADYRAAEAEVRTLREALERAADELDMAENIVGYDLSEAKADVVRALARAKEP